MQQQGLGLLAASAAQVRAPSPSFSAHSCTPPPPALDPLQRQPTTTAATSHPSPLLSSPLTRVLVQDTAAALQSTVSSALLVPPHAHPATAQVPCLRLKNGEWHVKRRFLTVNNGYLARGSTAEKTAARSIEAKPSGSFTKDTSSLVPVPSIRCFQHVAELLGRRDVVKISHSQGHVVVEQCYVFEAATDRSKFMHALLVSAVPIKPSHVPCKHS